MYLGNCQLDAAYLGNCSLDKLYLGMCEVFSSGPRPVFLANTYDPDTFEMLVLKSAQAA